MTKGLSKFKKTLFIVILFLGLSLTNANNTTSLKENNRYRPGNIILKNKKINKICGQNAYYIDKSFTNILQNSDYMFLYFEGEIIYLGKLSYIPAKKNTLNCNVLEKTFNGFENYFIIEDKDGMVYFIEKSKLKKIETNHSLNNIKNKKLFSSFFNVIRNKDIYIHPDTINRFYDKFKNVSYGNKQYLIYYNKGTNIESNIEQLFNTYKENEKDLDYHFRLYRYIYNNYGFRTMYRYISKVKIEYNTNAYDNYMEVQGNVDNSNFAYTQTALGQYIEGGFVCAGIVDLFDKIGEYIGLNIQPIHGLANGDASSNNGIYKFVPHAWFKYKGYVFDPTFDSTISNSSGKYWYDGIKPECLVGHQETGIEGLNNISSQYGNIIKRNYSWINNKINNINSNNQYCENIVDSYSNGK